MTDKSPEKKEEQPAEVDPAAPMTVSQLKEVAKSEISKRINRIRNVPWLSPLLDSAQTTAKEYGQRVDAALRDLEGTKDSEDDKKDS